MAVTTRKKGIMREPTRGERTGVHANTWRRWEHEGLVPKRITLGLNAVGWRVADIEQWEADVESGEWGKKLEVYRARLRAQRA